MGRVQKSPSNTDKNPSSIMDPGGGRKLTNLDDTTHMKFGMQPTICDA